MDRLFGGWQELLCRSVGVLALAAWFRKVACLKIWNRGTRAGRKRRIADNCWIASLLCNTESVGQGERWRADRFVAEVVMK